MQGFETFDLLNGDFPQNKMYKFYKCLNNDWSQWDIFNPKYNENVKNTTLDTYYAEYHKGKNFVYNVPGFYNLCGENKTWKYPD